MGEDSISTGHRRAGAGSGGETTEEKARGMGQARQPQTLVTGAEQDEKHRLLQRGLIRENWHRLRVKPPSSQGDGQLFLADIDSFMTDRRV